MGVNAGTANAIAAAVAGMIAGTMTQAAAATAIEAALDGMSTPATLTASITDLISSNEALSAAISAWNIRGESDTTAGLPTSASPGDGWLVAGNLYLWLANFWAGPFPFVGPAGSTIVDIGFSTTHLNTPSEIFGTYTATAAITLSQSRSKATADAPAAAAATYSILKDGVSAGTVVFSAGSPVGTVTLTNTALGAGDKLQVVAPSSPDATLSDVSITISGNRQ